MQNPLFDLTGRTALVTGGSRGLGRAIALGLARQGAFVAIADWNPEGLEDTVAAIQGLGVKAAGFRCDVSQDAEVRRLVVDATAALGPLDILVNNAGITKRIPLFDWTQNDWEEVIRVNQVGTFLVAREVGKQMIERRRGSIINMSALGGGMVGLGRGNAVYCSTKGAILALTRELAAEWAQFGVRVNCIAPGWFKTEMNNALLKHAEMVERIVERVPLGRLGEPEDVVGPVVFLASDAAAMITGHILPIDGGAHGVICLSQEAVVR